MEKYLVDLANKIYVENIADKTKTELILEIYKIIEIFEKENVKIA